MNQMRAIILAAGQGNVLDGMIKCLIRHPVDGKSILEHMALAFAGMKITVVAGYRAIEIIQQFPQFDYVINEEWAVTNSAYSLGLALNDEPCFVTSGDLLFTPALIRKMLNGPPDLALTSPRENRGLTAISCICGEEDRIVETYMGPLRSNEHDELLGIYKISSLTLLQKWKKNSLKHSNLFNGQTLPMGEADGICRLQIPDNEKVYEINTVTDYLRLVREAYGQ